MKSRVLFASLLFVASLGFLSSCSSGDKKPPSGPIQSNKVQYQCPMKCTDEIFDKPGKCPVCEMELEKITNS